MVKINSGGAAASGAGSKPERAKIPKKADNRQPPENTQLSPQEQPREQPQEPTPTAAVLRQASRDGTPFCEECEQARKQQNSKRKDRKIKKQDQ